MIFQRFSFFLCAQQNLHEQSLKRFKKKILKNLNSSLLKIYKQEQFYFGDFYLLVVYKGKNESLSKTHQFQISPLLYMAIQRLLLAFYRNQILYIVCSAAIFMLHIQKLFEKSMNGSKCSRQHHQKRSSCVNELD